MHRLINGKVFRHQGAELEGYSLDSWQEMDPSEEGYAQLLAWLSEQEANATEQVDAYNHHHGTHGRFASGSASEGHPDLDHAVKVHGLTDQLAEAGFVLPSGNMLNLSRGRTGKRNMDHGDIDLWFHGDKFNATEKMLNAGAIRISSDPKMFNIIETSKTPLTHGQKQVIKLMLEQKGRTQVEVGQPGEKNEFGWKKSWGQHYEEHADHHKVIGDIARMQRGENLMQFSELIEQIDAFNPHHDSHGRFAASGGFAALLAKHGETDDIHKAGFVFPDGKMLDMSQGSAQRWIDHNNLRVPGSHWDKGATHNTPSPTEVLLAHGAVRISVKGMNGLIHTGGIPLTFNQKGPLTRIMHKFGGNVIVSVDNTHPEISHISLSQQKILHDQKYRDAKPIKIFGDIARKQRGEEVNSTEEA